MVTGKCYQSNKRSYHQIRYQSDKLCKENSLSVIENYERFKKKYKTNGKSWYVNEQAKNGTSWKSKLQFDIDRMIKQAKDWEEFLEKIAELGYEIKYGKHIAFKPKDKPRFTRAKIIGEDYTEDRLKERISENISQKTFAVKKRIGRVAAYCRVSTDNIDQLLSLDTQKQHYENYIKSNPEWEYAGLYYDEGISGT